MHGNTQRKTENSKLGTGNSAVFGRSRFTFLTSRMVRLEWAEDGVFEDRLTLTVSSRKTPRVDFTRTERGGTVVLKTQHLTLTHRPDGKPLSKANLTIAFKLKGRTVTWHPGQKDRLNLKGTARTLDGVNGSKEKVWVHVEKKDPKLAVLRSVKNGEWVWQGKTRNLPLCDGLISRSGWAVVDDSESVVLDPELCDWQPWVREREPGRRQDLYFLGYGHAYKDALREAALVFGRQPLPPRYALGYWYSRYWAYTDKELLQLVDDFDTMDLPLDVLVIDMDWHKPGWTGYSWDRDYFPDPKDLLRTLRKRGVKITLNLHPADGVFDFEDAFPAMLKEMGLRRKDLPDLEPVYHRLYELLGLDPKKAKRIPLDICDPNYMRAYFKCLHHPMEKDGIDFWWMDWQQGNQGSQLPNLDTLPWINELHWQDQARRRPTKRPLNFSRFGGIGAGRMPVGFSGDTLISWDSLAYQPYFTATAANVLYGYWSHDIGGHMQGDLTPELYTRWLQFGLFSSVLRTHTSKQIDFERRVFHFPHPERDVMMRVLRRRYRLVPYLYGEMRKAADSGVSLVRPLYHDWPEEENAYRCKNQFAFGDDLLVAPVIRPTEEKDEMAPVSVWLPKGDWHDTALGTNVSGGRIHERRYTVEETPVFVRPGTVVPEQGFTRRLLPGSYPELVFRIYPGAKGSCELYEDDGESTAWEKGESVRLRVEHSLRGDSRTVTLHPAKGGFKGFKAKRRVHLLLDGFAPPREVTAGKWTYDGDAATVAIDLGTVDLRKGLTLKIREAPATDRKRALGLKGLMTRLEKIRAYNCSVSSPRPLHADERLAVKAAQTGNRISRHPETFRAEMRQLRGILDRLPAALKEYEACYHDAEATEPSRQELALHRARGILATTRKQFLPGTHR